MDSYTTEGTTWQIRVRKAIAALALSGMALGAVGAAGAVSASADAEPVEEAATWSFRIDVDGDNPKDGPVFGARATWS